MQIHRSPHLDARLLACGQPWHGLAVQPDGGDAYITLPNGAHHIIGGTLSGETRWVNVGAPVVRTPEQIAADQAAGMEWRSDAVLNSRYIGSALRWLYQSSTGAVWEICPEPDYNTLLARPFGVIGAPIAPVTVSQSALLAAHGTEFTVNQMALRDVRPDLKRALYTVPDPVSGHQLFEVTVTDAGAISSITLSISLIGTYGIDSHVVTPTYGTRYRAGYIEDPLMNYCQAIAIDSIVALSIVTVTTQVLMPRYRPDGSITVIEGFLDNDVNGTGTWDGDVCAGDISTSNTITHAQRLRLVVDGAEVHRESCQSVTQRVTHCQTDNGSYAWTQSIAYGGFTVSSSYQNPYRITCHPFYYPCDTYFDTTTYADYYVHELYGSLRVRGELPMVDSGQAVTVDANCVVTVVGDTHPDHDRLFLHTPGHAVPGVIGYGFHFGVYDNPQDAQVRAIKTAAFVQMTNNIVTIERYDRTTSTVSTGPFVTPLGEVAHPDVERPTDEAGHVIGSCYASYHPRTGEVSIGETPRCWF